MDVVRSPLIDDIAWTILNGERYGHRYSWVERQRLHPPLLDVGCGQGVQSVFLSRRVGPIDCVDNDPYCIRICRDTAMLNDVPITVHSASAYDLPFAAGSYNTVTAFEMLEHLEFPAAALAEYRRVMATGGTLLISTPTKGSMPPGEVEGHVQDFSVADLVAMMDGAGFDTVNVEVAEVFQMIRGVAR
jgi:2-polyprenyl-3-methyl-5-hydroxy-6-metoxy-1,4-benzoquinol methylase